MNHSSSSNDDTTISGALRPKEKMKKTELWVTFGSDAGIFKHNTSLVIQMGPFLFELKNIAVKDSYVENIFTQPLFMAPHGATMQI